MRDFQQNIRKKKLLYCVHGRKMLYNGYKNGRSGKTIFLNSDLNVSIKILNNQYLAKEGRKYPMKKILAILLVLLFTCSMFACKTDDPSGIGETAPETEAPKTVSTEKTGADPTAAPAPAGTDVPKAETPAKETVSYPENARALSLTENADTYWSDGQNEYRILIYDDSEAYLMTPNGVLTLTEDGDAYLAETKLYRSPFDTESAAVFTAGQVRLLTDGYALKIKVADDPLNILKYDALDGLVLEKQDFEPYRYSDYNFFSGPLEPGTEWFCYFNMGEYHYARLNMTIGWDGSIYGTLVMPEGTQRTCVLLVNGDSFALIDESADSPELLFYGSRNRIYETYYNTERYGLVRIALDPVFDPLGLCLLSEFNLRRQDGREGELPYILGKSLDSLILELTRDGWQDQTEQLVESEPCLEGWYARLTIDDWTLLIYYLDDYGIPYEAYQSYVYAYVLYGADGTVLSWSGSKPVDHELADAHKIRSGVHFNPGAGIDGLMIGEDVDTYFLDDGRLVIRGVDHLEDPDMEDVGDIDFITVKVIP